jgi:hypothetical protein
MTPSIAKYIKWRLQPDLPGELLGFLIKTIYHKTPVRAIREEVVKDNRKIQTAEKQKTQKKEK